jgi:hypothetical protein
VRWYAWEMPGFPFPYFLLPPYDVFSVSDVVLNLLDDTWVKAIKTAQVAYKNNDAGGASVQMAWSDGASGKPVLVITGKGFDATAGAKLQVHFHGDKCTISDIIGDGGLSGTIIDLQAADPQRIVVLPECKNPLFATPGGKTPSYAPNWANIVDLVALQDDALKASGASSVVSGGYIVSAHSGGGHGIRDAMRADIQSTSGRRFRCDQLRLVDCIQYSTNPKGPDFTIENTIVQWARLHPGEIASVVAVMGTMGKAPNVWPRIKTAFTGGGSTTSYKDIEVQNSQSADFVPEPVPVPMDKDPTGQAVRRWGVGQVHERARSQFMGLDA